mgnify:FL=1
MSTCKRAAEESIEDAQASNKAKKVDTVWWERLVVLRNNHCEVEAYSISKDDIPPKYWTILDGYKNFSGEWNGVIETSCENLAMDMKQEKKINAFLDEQVAQESTKPEENTCEVKYTGLGPFEMNDFLDTINELCDHSNRVSWQNPSVGMAAAFYVMLGIGL